ncbi:sulfatase-like hydrolase/transferase [Maritimibacter alkaliphilus]|uniref:sulfatase-like hydrolase/transferase n=1 Tax=Maritimibacter alkaliphilus TaxID=404236 RepID=UPI001C95AA13|nr:sulfatase-like hydrolase/transferase [Maritimibacter alkaliphilus]MBY6088929.1 sulfatase-like hydrolase/transferase [Maritimibacter alkaliphilus]
MTSRHLRNVLLICLDDAVAYWHYRTAFGQPLQTPNLDRICAQSTRFEAAYCQAPVCSPSRASFMSGLSPHQTGIVKRNADYLDAFGPRNLWPYALKQNGFYSSTGGKVVRGYRALPAWAHEILHSDPRTGYNPTRRKRFYPDRKVPGLIEMGGFRSGLASVTPKGDAKLYCNKVATRAMAFLGSHDPAVPFYRGVGFQSPHGPWITPRHFKDIYDVRQFRRPEAWQGGFPESEAGEALSPKSFDTRRARYWKKSVRNYFSSLTYADYQIGRVWDALKASPHAKDTLVVILADHGLHLGDRQRFTKGGLWEQIANVPLIIHDPRAPEAQVVRDPVGLIDVGNTVMDFLGQPPIPGSVGQSLKPQMEGASVPDRAVPTFHKDASAIRKGRYRHILYGDGSSEFYDVEDDWWQTRPLRWHHPDRARIRAAHDLCRREYGMEPGMAQAAE